MPDVLSSSPLEPPAAPGPAPAGVVARGVRRSSGPVGALRGIDLTARPGEVTALVGPEGAGTTTLLLVLATLLVPDAGEITVAGHDPVHEPDAVRARTGWVPEVAGLHDALTAREHLHLFGEAHRLGRAASRRRAVELLELVRLTGSADRPARTLARGQQQRLGLARALVHEPEVLLLDGPASRLDPGSLHELRGLLRALARAGTTVVVASHALGDVEELADRVVLVDRGATVGEHQLDRLPAGSPPRTWRVRSSDVPALVAALRRSACDFGEPTPAGVDVLLSTDEAAAALLAGLVRDGVPVVAFQPLGDALEAATRAPTGPDR